MSANNRSKWWKGEDVTVLKKLLGSLELEIMEFMWPVGEATVLQVVESINSRRRIAYTTVMTVMGHLADKGLLARTKEGKRYRYQVVRSKDEFLRETSEDMIRSLLEDFGDIALVEFLGEISKINADKLEQLRNLVQKASSESDVSK